MSALRRAEPSARRGRVRISELFVDRAPETIAALRQMMQIEHEERRDGFVDLIGQCSSFDQVNGFIPAYEASFRRAPGGELNVTFRRIG